MSLEQRRNKARSTREQTRWNSARRRSDPYYPSWSRRESHRRRRDQGCCAALRMPTTASLNMPMRIPADRTPESRVRRHGVAVRRHSAAWRHADGPSGRPSRLPTLVATKNGHGRALTDPVDHGDGDGTSSPPRVSAQITDPGLLDCRRSGAPPPAPPRRGLQGLNGPGGAHPGSAGDPDRGPPPQTVRRGCAPTSPTLLQTQPTPPTVRSPDRPPHTRTPNPEPRHGARLAALGRDATPGPAPGTRVPVTDRPTEKTPHTPGLRTATINEGWSHPDDQSDTPTDPAGGPQNRSALGTGGTRHHAVDLDFLGDWALVGGRGCCRRLGRHAAPPTRCACPQAGARWLVRYSPGWSSTGAIPGTGRRAGAGSVCPGAGIRRRSAAEGQGGQPDDPADEQAVDRAGGGRRRPR